jgi:hypothetical protein
LRIAFYFGPIAVAFLWCAVHVDNFPAVVGEAA